MKNLMIFSLQTMKDCNGNAMQDAEYLKYFLDECESRLKAAAKALRDIAQGTTAIGPSCPEEAGAQLAEVRRHAYLLKECEEWFKGKPPVAANFTKLLQELRSTIDRAESDFQLILGWFK